MSIESYLNEFTAISLEQMETVQLMDRVDTKFAFRLDKLPKLLKRLEKFYNVLEINNKKVQTYKSLYYDTDDRVFFIEHHNQRVNRNKVRFREYVDSGLTFLEIKLKNNKGKTIKKRIKVDSISNQLSEEHQDYINKIIGKKLVLNPKQWINFSRITFVNKMYKERLTIDTNLTFSNKIKMGGLKEIVIAEVKQDRMKKTSQFMRIAKEQYILPVRLSKYCMSTIELDSDIKHNRFKEKVLLINKLKQS